MLLNSVTKNMCKQKKIGNDHETWYISSVCFDEKIIIISQKKKILTSNNKNNVNFSRL